MSQPTRVFASIVSARIEPAVLLARAGGPDHGAVILFLGTVRDHNEGRLVSGVRYDAYVEMAEEVLGQIAEEAAALSEGGRVAVVHRVGELDVEEVSVAVVVSSAHRAAAYSASRHVIEEIKRRLPVWKQERYQEGDARWLDGVTPAPAGAPARARRKP